MAFFEALQSPKKTVDSSQEFDEKLEKEKDNRMQWSRNDISFVELNKLQEKERSFIREGKIPIYNTSPSEPEPEQLASSENSEKLTKKVARSKTACPTLRKTESTIIPLTTRYRVLRSPHGILFRSKTDLSDLSICGYSRPPTSKSTSTFLHPPKTAPELSRSIKTPKLQSISLKSIVKHEIHNLRNRESTLSPPSPDRLVVNSSQDNEEAENADISKHAEDQNEQHDETAAFAKWLDTFSRANTSADLLDTGDKKKVEFKVNGGESSCCKPLPDAEETENYGQAILDYVEVEYKVKTPEYEPIRKNIDDQPKRGNNRLSSHQETNNKFLFPPKSIPASPSPGNYSPSCTSPANFSDFNDFSKIFDDYSVDLNIESPDSDLTDVNNSSEDELTNEIFIVNDKNNKYLTPGGKSHSSSAKSEPNRTGRLSTFSLAAHQQRSKSAHLPPVKGPRSPFPPPSQKGPSSSDIPEYDGPDLSTLLVELAISRPDKFSDKKGNTKTESVGDDGEDDNDTHKPWRYREYSMIDDVPVMPDSVIPIWNKLPPGEIDYASDTSSPPPHTVPFIDAHSRRSSIHSISSVGSISLSGSLANGEYRPVFNRTWDEIDRITNVPPYGHLKSPANTPRAKSSSPLPKYNHDNAGDPKYTTQKVDNIRQVKTDPVYFEYLKQSHGIRSSTNFLPSTRIGNFVNNQNNILKSTMKLPSSVNSVNEEKDMQRSNATESMEENYEAISSRLNLTPINPDLDRDQKPLKEGTTTLNDKLQVEFDEVSGEPDNQFKSFAKPSRGKQNSTAKKAPKRAAIYRNISRKHTANGKKSSEFMGLSRSKTDSEIVTSHTKYITGSVGIEHFILLGKELAKSNPLKPMMSRTNEDDKNTFEDQPFMLRSKSFLKDAKEQIQRSIDLARKSAKKSSSNRPKTNRPKTVTNKPKTVQTLAS